jgi:tetratricopeptide (TPR) repeat protein
MELAYQRGLLTREAELLTLARYLLYRQLPYRAGELLERGLRQGVVRPVNQNWRLLIDAWTRAREPNLALAAIERALDTTKDVNLYLRRAQLLAEKEEWSQVVATLEAALGTGGLAFPGQAHFLQGIAHYQLQNPHKAVSCFQRAKAYEDSKSQAEQWIEHLTGTLEVASNEDSSRGFSPLFR